MLLFDLKELRGINGWFNLNLMYVDCFWEWCDCNWGWDYLVWERSDLSDMVEGWYNLFF